MLVFLFLLRNCLSVYRDDFYLQLGICEYYSSFLVVFVAERQKAWVFRLDRLSILSFSGSIVPEHPLFFLVFVLWKLANP